MVVKSRFQQKSPILEYGGQQIVPRPFFSDFPYKNRVGHFLAKILGSKGRLIFAKTPKSCPIIMKFIIEVKTFPATRFKLIFDEILFFLRHILKPVLDQSQLSQISTCKSNCPQVYLRNSKEQLLTNKLKHMST